ncbi:MAG TPA: hypothetical protein VFN21_07965 [Acidimicrobiales bacterium]|nr:hypothetical protein [Acidimicrobiales bacterium]
MTEPTAPLGPNAAPSADRDLVVLFSKSLRLLGEAGYPAAANRLAAKAWWALKDDDLEGARRVNGVMHYLAKLPEEPAEIGRQHTTVPATTNTGVT